MQTKLIVLLAAALLQIPAAMAAEYERVSIADVPHVKQKPDFCGEACVEMVLRKLGHNINQDDVFNASNADPASGRGCATPQLIKAMIALGFKAGETYSYIAASNAAVEIEGQWKSLHEDLLKGVPSIVCMHYDNSADAPEHFRLVTGYEAETDDVIYNEPAVDDGASKRMKRSDLMALWPLKYSKDRWTLIRLRCEPGTIKKAKLAAGFTPADYVQHVMELKKKIPNKSFSILIEPPFVIVSDEALEQARIRATKTVKWAVGKLKQDYFKKDPADIIDIWLFKDAESYEKNTAAIFKESPSTPFGFYSEQEKALIMNIGTGGGTLIHEMVHPFMRANFPKCPPWFFEGMGSLFEQCQEKDGHIVGRTNWRLEGLQNAIEAESLPIFAQLMGMLADEFYTLDRGTNYAQSRYLCYYLQEKGLLIKFYKDFVSTVENDPTGYEQLMKVLGIKDMPAFQKEWQEYVMKLTFP